MSYEYDITIRVKTSTHIMYDIEKAVHKAVLHFALSPVFNELIDFSVRRVPEEEIQKEKPLRRVK